MSKKVIKIVKLPYEKELVLDYRASVAMNEPFEVYVKNSINNTIAYKLIRIINCKTLSASVVSAITPAYLSGTVISINGVQFVNPKPKYRYGYQWIDFNRNTIPKSLAEFKVGQSTFLAELQKVRSNYLPNNLWLAIDDYSQERIAKCIEYNKFDFECAEHWYKELMNMNGKLFRVYSPNEKTWYEWTAEKWFEQSLQDVQLAPGLRALDTDELAFLKEYASAYGIEIPELQWRYNYHKTAHGYTREPELITGGASLSDLSKCYVDPRNKGKQDILPRSVREDYMIKTCDNDKLIRDAYEQLIYLMRLKDDNMLMPGYKRCPVCHKIYRENDGCGEYVSTTTSTVNTNFSNNVFRRVLPVKPCSSDVKIITVSNDAEFKYHIEPITTINANNLFYGIGSEFHDIDAEQEYLDRQEDELADIFELESLFN